jgi:hypothetical protein
VLETLSPDFAVGSVYSHVLLPMVRREREEVVDPTEGLVLDLAAIDVRKEVVPEMTSMIVLPNTGSPIYDITLPNVFEEISN